jgi:hypothetical protein
MPRSGREPYASARAVGRSSPRRCPDDDDDDDDDDDEEDEAEQSVGGEVMVGSA